MSHTIRKAFVVAGLVALIASLSGCAAPLPGGNGECEFTVDYPHGSTDKAGFIDGKGKVKCTYSSGSLTNLEIETRLQKWNGSSWVTVANSTRTTSVGAAKSGVTYTGVSNFIICQSGTFRTQSSGSGALNGVTNSSAGWQTTDMGRGVRNPCVKPLQIVSVG